MTRINFGFSSCPNDTFIVHALLDHRIDTGRFEFVPHVHDVELLNLKAALKEYDVTKLSCFAYLKLKDSYALLDAGAALGYGCGPLLVARSADLLLRKARIAVPGAHTTAHLLLKLWNPDLRQAEATRFDRILPGIASGEFDAGIIIHEGRFVYPAYGCIKIVDLGQWWEEKTSLPIPLGCMAVRNDPEMSGHREEIERILRNSVQYALKNPAASREFVESYAQEMDREVINQHIALYVNDFTLSLGATGKKAIKTLEEMARWQKIL